MSRSSRKLPGAILKNPNFHIQDKGKHTKIDNHIVTNFLFNCIYLVQNICKNVPNNIVFHADFHYDVKWGLDNSS